MTGREKPYIDDDELCSRVRTVNEYIGLEGIAGRDGAGHAQFTSRYALEVVSDAWSGKRYTGTLRSLHMVVEEEVDDVLRERISGAAELDSQLLRRSGAWPELMWEKSWSLAVVNLSIDLFPLGHFRLRGARAGMGKGRHTTIRIQRVHQLMYDLDRYTQRLRPVNSYSRRWIDVSLRVEVIAGAHAVPEAGAKIYHDSLSPQYIIIGPVSDYV